MITAEQLEELAVAARIDPLASAMRQRFPELHFSECSADDVSPCQQPVLGIDGYDLYLIAGASGHCLALTSDLASATGVLLAARVDEE
ncbi:MAG: hypothetical protein KDI64_21860 [Candidatus Accumulibacter sp.]|nr:hypothetical protein [Accumulibacter sp.]